MIDEAKLNPYGIRDIPETILNRLLELRDTLTSSYWEIGDTANEVWELALANRMEVLKGQVFSQVAQVVGVAGRTIRYYASTAAFYDQKDREDYQVLPFSHFAFAMGFRGGEPDGTPTYRAVLDKSLEYMEAHGVPPSVDRLASLYYQEIKGQREEYGEEAFAGRPDLQIQEKDAGELERELFGGVKINDPAKDLRATIRNGRALVIQLNRTMTDLDELQRGMGLPSALPEKLAQVLTLSREVMRELEEYEYTIVSV